MDTIVSYVILYIKRHLRVHQVGVDRCVCSPAAYCVLEWEWLGFDRHRVVAKEAHVGPSLPTQPPIEKVCFRFPQVHHRQNDSCILVSVVLTLVPRLPLDGSTSHSSSTSRLPRRQPITFELESPLPKNWCIVHKPANWIRVSWYQLLSYQLKRHLGTHVCGWRSCAISPRISASTLQYSSPRQH